jgi:hypothetical protein
MATGEDVAAGFTRRLQLWILFASNATSWLIGIPIVFLVSIEAEGSELAVALALAATTVVGTLVVLLVPVVSERVRLRVDSGGALMRSYFLRYLLRVGFVDLPVCVGGAAWVLTGEAFVYVVGVPFTLLAAARAAPTGNRIAIDQQEVTDQGSSLSLADLLDQPPRAPL